MAKEKMKNPLGNILDCKEEALTFRTNAAIDRLLSSGGEAEDGNTFQKLLYVCIDATKVGETVKINPAFESIHGFAHPHQNYPMGDLDSNKMIPASIFDGKSLASEACCVLLSSNQTIHDGRVAEVVSAFATTTNANITESCLKPAISVIGNAAERKNCFLVSVACDGSMSCYNFIGGMLFNFVSGSSNTIGLTDLNHAAKNMRSCLITGNLLRFIGDAYLDGGLLVKAGIAKELYNVSDFTSDNLVQKLCSPASLSKICTLLNQDEEDEQNVCAVASFLYFLRAGLIAGNGNNICKKQRILMLWSSYLFFDSIHGIDCKTKENYGRMAFGMCCLIIQEDVTLPRRTTTELAEHMFGFLRLTKNSFILSELADMIFKFQSNQESMQKNNIFSGKSKKGYLASFPDFMDALKKDNERRNARKAATLNVDNGDDDVYPGVKVDYDCKDGESVFTQIAPSLLSILNEAAECMSNFLKKVIFKT